MLLLDICILTQSSVISVVSNSVLAFFTFIVSSWPVSLKKKAGTTRSGCYTSNFLLSWSLSVCVLSLPLYYRINLLFHLPVPLPSRSLIHLISTLWLVQSSPLFSFGSSSIRPVPLAAPYSGEVVSLGVIVPVADRSIGRNCVAVTVELKREGTNWILAQSM